MTSLASQISDAGYADRIISDRQLSRLVEGSSASRYGLVNRALKGGSLIRLKRGLYTLSPKWRRSPPHPYAIAQAILPGSYVTFETALSHHGWIPEAVYQTASVTPGRKSLDVEHDLYGRFSFRPLAINAFEFLRGVEREVVDGQATFVASPFRALFDLIAYRKEEWRGIDALISNLRLDAEHLEKVRRKDIARFKTVYKQKRVLEFIAAFENSMVDLTSKKATARK